MELVGVEAKLKWVKEWTGNKEVETEFQYTSRELTWHKGPVFIALSH